MFSSINYTISIVRIRGLPEFGLDEESNIWTLEIAKIDTVRPLQIWKSNAKLFLRVFRNPQNFIKVAVYQATMQDKGRQKRLENGKWRTTSMDSLTNTKIVSMFNLRKHYSNNIITLCLPNTPQKTVGDGKEDGQWPQFAVKIMNSLTEEKHWRGCYTT